jgi:hypothetical protein
VKIKISTYVPETDAKEDRSGERAIPDSQKNPKGQIETIRGQGPTCLHPLSRGVSSAPKELVDVFEGGFINPIQDHQFGAQVQLLHLSAPQIQDLGRRSKFTVQDQGQADIFDSAFRKVSLVNASVLDYCPTQRDLTNTGHIGHCLGPRRRLGRSKIWGQLRHVEPPSVRIPHWER